MNDPNPQRLGGLQWTRRTGGRLTRSERGRLVASIAIGQWENAVGRAKLAVGRIPARARDVDATTFRPPDTRLAREAEDACAEQPGAIVGHSYRTWMFGLALATIDRAELDHEQFYCTALVHDYGIAKPSSGRDFTLAGAERAIAFASTADVTPDVGEAMADAICVHTTPGITVPRDGTLGCYVQWGAMTDGAGLRLWDIAPTNVTEIVDRYPRGAGFKTTLAQMMRAEAKAVPGGRFSLLVCCGVPLAVRLAPFKD